MSNQWKNSLFGCFDDIPVCLMGCCVPCYLFGQNAEQIDSSGKIKMCVIYCLASSCYLQCLVHKPRREKLRQAYGLVEKPNDLLATCCCTCCANIQEAKEMKANGVQPGGHIPVSSQPTR